MPWAFLGGLASGMFGQSSANQSMAFQKEVAQHGVRWRVEDMKKAGINPLLSVNGGGAAAASGGAQASGGDLASGVNSALAAKRIKHEIKVLQAQARDANASAQNKEDENPGVKFRNLPFKAGNSVVDDIVNAKPPKNRQSNNTTSGGAARKRRRSNK
jgi:hypothetical protein